MASLTVKEVIDKALAHTIAEEFVRKHFCMADDPGDARNACDLPKEHKGDCHFNRKPWEK